MPTSDLIRGMQDTLNCDEPLAKRIQLNEHLISIKGNLKKKIGE